MAADLHDRLRGALLGTALGDALGAPFEGRRRIARAEVEAWLSSPDVLRWTDDTHMAITLGQVLCDHGGDLDSEHLGAAFATAYETEPWRGYGAGPPRVFALARQGMSYLDAAGSLFAGTGSFGNGAAMRVAPVALVACSDAARATELAAVQARVTHAHPEAVEGAVFIAVAIGALATEPTRPAVDVLGDVVERLPPGAIRTGVTQIVTAARTGADPLAEAQRLGTGIAARESVPAAVAAVLAGRDLVTALVAAVCLGGDTDTIAAMAGAMAGAAHGASAIPEQLLTRLEARTELDELATALLSW